MKICIPSRGRAKKISTTKVFTEAFVFVPESEYNEYSNEIDNDLVSIPDKIKGITKARNFILDYFKDEDVVMIDDDLKEIGCFIKGKRINLFNSDYEKEITDLLKQTFELTKQMGFDIFGFESGGSLFANHVLKPISYSGAINGTVIGIVSSKERFNEDYQVKEDFEFILRSYMKNGGYIKINYLYIRTKHWANLGGCVDYRTNQMEEDCIEMLNEKYNGMFSVGKGKNIYHTSITV